MSCHTTYQRATDGLFLDSVSSRSSSLAHRTRVYYVHDTYLARSMSRHEMCRVPRHRSCEVCSAIYAEHRAGEAKLNVTDLKPNPNGQNTQVCGVDTTPYRYYFCCFQHHYYFLQSAVSSFFYVSLLYAHFFPYLYRCSKVEKDPIESVRNLRKKRTRVKSANPVHVDEGMNARAFVFGVRGCSVASASTVCIHWY